MAGDLTLTAHYTPWGDTLDTYGMGDFTFGYFGGVMDVATGLLYVGNGQYYDPATGRFLTRDARPNSTNPYVPWDPTGAIIGPLAAMALFFGKKRKRSKWDTLIIIVLLGITTGIGAIACSPAPTTPATGSNTPPSFPMSAQTPVPGAGTSTSNATGTPAPSVTPTLPDCPTATLTPTPGEPTRPAGLDSSLEDVWQTYINLWKKQDTDAWWWQRVKGAPSFTPLDFLHWLLLFEFYHPKADAPDYEGILKEVAVGNFCFYTHTDPNDIYWLEQGGKCIMPPSDLEVFRFIKKRRSLDGGKDYLVRGTDPEDYKAWMDLDLYQKWDSGYFSAVDFVENFKHPNPGWLDWRTSDGINDPLVETGNKEKGFNQELYNGFKKLNPGNKNGIGRKTNQLGALYGSAHFFTFCQYTYYRSQGGNAEKTTCTSNLVPNSAP